MSNKQNIEFDYKKYKLLKNAYKNAINQNLEEFNFDNREILTSYCKYLLEYLDSKFKLI